MGTEADAGPVSLGGLGDGALSQDRFLGRSEAKVHTPSTSLFSSAFLTRPFRTASLQRRSCFPHSYSVQCITSLSRDFSLLPPIPAAIANSRGPGAAGCHFSGPRRRVLRERASLFYLVHREAPCRLSLPGTPEITAQLRMGGRCSRSALGFSGSALPVFQPL